MEYLKAGQLFVNDIHEKVEPGLGRGKTTGGTYDCEFDCDYERFSIYWPDGTLQYPCTRLVEYDDATDTWSVKADIPYCEHDLGVKL